MIVYIHFSALTHTDKQQYHYHRDIRRHTASVTSTLSSSTGESGLTGETRVNITLEKRIPKKHKYIKPTALSPFLPVNKILLNGANDDNPETIDTSLSVKYYRSHTSKDDFTGKTNDKKS